MTSFVNKIIWYGKMMKKQISAESFEEHMHCFAEKYIISQ